VTYGFDTSFLVAAEVAEHPHHAGVWRRIGLLREQDARLAITMPVIAEFIHIVTDARRFSQPLPCRRQLRRRESGERQTRSIKSARMTMR
jgi:predicted nucleic acid-binding protein